MRVFTALFSLIGRMVGFRRQHATDQRVHGDDDDRIEVVEAEEVDPQRLLKPVLRKMKLPRKTGHGFWCASGGGSSGRFTVSSSPSR